MKSAAEACWIASIILAASLSAMAGEGATIPRVDRCRVVYSFEPETRLFQANDGSVCLDVEPQVWNEHTAKRYVDRPLPIPHRRLREYTDGEGRLSEYDPLTGIDAQSRPWFLSVSSEDGLTVRWIEEGRLESKAFGQGYGRDDHEIVGPARWPWVGTDMLGDENGIWLAGPDKVFRILGDPRLPPAFAPADRKAGREPRPKRAGETGDASVIDQVS